ncbi:MAG: hypothetical protein LBT00_03065, partial [Spirochaetaceae bacterium]|nr:hypothetical protein [Spirochaetaceae bacterium]
MDLRPDVRNFLKTRIFAAFRACSKSQQKGEVSPFAPVFALRYPPLRGSDPRNAPESQRRLTSCGV